MPLNSSSRVNLERIRAIISDLNDTSKYGEREALIQRHLVVLYMVNVHPLFMDGGKKDQDNDLHYYSAPTLSKAVKATAKEWQTEQIKFGGWRSATNWYKVCDDLGYVRIRYRPGNEQLYALTAEGFNRSRE